MTYEDWIGHRIDDDQGRGARRGGQNRVPPLRAPSGPDRHALRGAAARHRREISRRALSAGHIRLGGHGPGGGAGHRLSPGGLRHPRGPSRDGAPGRRGRGAGRRGREDTVPDRRGRARGAHERHLRRRHRRVHRPDGHPDGRARGAAGDPLPGPRAQLCHRQPLRRVRQVGHPAPAEPGGPQGGHRPQHLRGRGGADHRRPCPGAGDRRKRGVPGRPADLLLRASGLLRQGAGHPGHPPGGRAVLGGHGRGPAGRARGGPRGRDPPRAQPREPGPLRRLPAAVRKPAGIRSLPGPPRPGPGGDRLPPRLRRQGVHRHRLRLHHHQGRGRGRGFQPAQDRLHVQQGQSPARRAGFSAGILRRIPERHRGRGRRHRLRRGAGQDRLPAGLRRGGDHGPPDRRPEAAAGGGFHHRHRRPGHQVLQNKG